MTKARKNVIRTKEKSASKAGKLLKKVKDKEIKSVAGSTLVNRKKCTKKKP